MRKVSSLGPRYGLLLSTLVLSAPLLSGCLSNSWDYQDTIDREKVTVAAVPPPAISGGTLMVTLDGSTAVAADPDRDRIWIVDLQSRSLRRALQVAHGSEPGRVVEGGAGRAHVLLRRDGVLLGIDMSAGTIVDQRDVCPAPRGIAYDAKADTLHVACAGGELVTLPAKGGAPVRSLRLDRDLRDVVIDGDQLLVSRFRSAELLVVNKDGTVAERKTLPTFESTLTTTQTFAPAVAWRTVAMPGGGAMMVHQRGKSTPLVFVQGQSYYGDPGCDSSVLHGTISIFRSSGQKSETEQRPSEAIPNVSLPVDVAVANNGKDVAMVAAGSNVVFRTSSGAIEAEAGQQFCNPSGTPVTVRGEPVAVAFNPSTGRFLVQSREPAALIDLDSADVDFVNFGAESRKDTAHEMFHKPPSGSGTAACASCHPEGAEDGRKWAFETIGERRTQTLALGGGISDTAPFHWSGDLQDVGALMTEVFSNRMSGSSVGPRRAKLMERWIDAQPAPAASQPLDTGAVARGEALFFDQKVGCASCHSGPKLTDNKTVDVGTGEKLQVPSLVGISSRAPFMHDGCAATLRDRFDGNCGGGDKHGLTSHLSSADIDDLVSYLETL